jgi:hypothetical protein
MSLVEYQKRFGSDVRRVLPHIHHVHIIGDAYVLRLAYEPALLVTPLSEEAVPSLLVAAIPRTVPDLFRSSILYGLEKCGHLKARSVRPLTFVRVCRLALHSRVDALALQYLSAEVIHVLLLELLCRSQYVRARPVTGLGRLLRELAV